MKRTSVCSRTSLAFLISLTTVAPAAAADWYWAAGCGANGWYDICSTDECSPGHPRQWNNWGQWACHPDQPAFPGSADDVHFGGLARIPYNCQPVVRNLFIGTGAEVSVQDGGHLTTNGTLMQNDGALWLRYGGIAGYGTLTIAGNTTLSGSGALRSEGGYLNGNGVLHVTADQTIRGYALYLSTALDNAGTLTAEQDGGIIDLREAAKSNSNRMQATGGAFLDIRTAISQTPTARIVADGGTVRLFNGADILSGQLETTGASDVRISGGDQSCILRDVTNLGVLTVVDGGTCALQNSTLTNNGVIRVLYGGTYGYATLRFDSSSIQLTGSGAIEFGGGSINGAPFVQAATHTIHGYTGTINASLTNHGIVDADVSNSVIALGTDPKYNAGVFRASNGGFLDIYVPVDQLSGAGRIVADGGTVRLFSGADILSGQLETTGASDFRISGGNQTCILRDVTNLGTLTVVDGGTCALQNSTLTNDGVIRVLYGGTYGNAALRLDSSNMQLAGSGAIEFGGGSINGAPFVQAATHTIHGDNGTINARLTNDGVVDADVSNSVIALGTDSKYNAGVFRASNGGFLDIYVPVDQVSGAGRIAADGGTVRFYNGSAVTTGALDSTGGGTLSLVRNGTTFDSVTNRGTLNVVDGGLLMLKSTFTNDGSVTVAYGGTLGNSTVRFDSNVQLQGSGEMVLAGAFLTSPNGEFFTQAATHTIRGYAADISAPFDNLGTIHSDANNNTIRLLGGDKNNRGLLKASGGGILELRTRIVQGSGEGRILADGGFVRLVGATILNGTLETVNGGTIYCDYSTCNLQDVTSEGVLQVGDGGTATLQGQLTNNGELDVYYGGLAGWGNLEFASNTTLDGTGAIVLTGGNLTSATGATATIGAGQIMHGTAANIDVALDNFGVIVSDTANNHIALRGAPKTNRNLLEATGNGFLDIGVPITQIENGRILADGGRVQLYGSAAILGGVLDTANGGQIYSDYQQSCVLQDVTNEGWLGAGNGGQFTLRGSLTDNGTVTLYYGGYAGAGHIVLDQNATLLGTGVLALETGDITSASGAVLRNGAGHTLTGAGPVSVELLNQGIVSPGNGVGTLPIHAAYTHQGTAELRVELRNPGQYDRLVVGGTADLQGGTLRIVPVDGFNPQVGQQFVVLTAAALSGQFASILGPGVYSVSYANNQVTLTLLHTAGDLDCNGHVDFGDINPFVLALSNPTQYAQHYPNCDIRTGDCNGDGLVNFADINPFVALLVGS